MDAKWNDFIDRTSVRLALVATGFAAWFGIAVGLISVA